MKETAYTLNDRKWRLIGIPLLSLAIVTILSFRDFLSLNLRFFLSFLASTVLTLVFWEGNRFIFIRMLRVFPGYDQTRQRLLAEALLALIYVLVISLLLDVLVYQPYYHQTGFVDTFRISIVPTLLVYLMYEAAYFFEAWKLNVRKSESLEREKVQSQLDALKDQLDPHFLFNSMNTLAALIDDENTDAQDYLERLADVYRYVLVSRDKNTVLLEEELACADAYIYLNKIRFRENLLVRISLPAEARRKYIAPLSLQMLIENAIKHNAASRWNPLSIDIYEEDDGYLTVENNLSEKTTLEKSTRVGLKNIVNRYGLLTDRKVEIVRNEIAFKVRIPLLSHLV